MARLATLAALLCILCACAPAQAAPQIGEPAPPLKGRLFNGEAFDLAVARPSGAGEFHAECALKARLSHPLLWLPGGGFVRTLENRCLLFRCVLVLRAVFRHALCILAYLTSPRQTCARPRSDVCGTIAVAVASACLTQAATPGFLCSKARTWVEKTICASERLSDLDLSWPRRSTLLRVATPARKTSAPSNSAGGPGARSAGASPSQSSAWIRAMSGASQS
jgi:hypothetical protein